MALDGEAWDDHKRAHGLKTEAPSSDIRTEEWLRLGRTFFAELLGIIPTRGPDSPIDRLYAAINPRLANPELGYGDKKTEVWYFEQGDLVDGQRRKDIYNMDEENLWVVFLPWGMTLEEGKQFGHIPPWARNVVVANTPQGFVNKDPAVIQEIFMNTIKGVRGHINQWTSNNEVGKINVISYSAANGGGFFTFNSLIPKGRHGEFYAVATGHGIMEEIGDAPVLGRIKSDAGIRTKDDARTLNALIETPSPDSVVAGGKIDDIFRVDESGRMRLLPFNNVDSLDGATHIIGGKHDIYIPVEYAQEIYRAAWEKNENVSYTQLPLGHIATIMYSVFLLDLRRRKDVREFLQSYAGVVNNVVNNLSEEIVKKYSVSFPKSDMPYWAAALILSREVLRTHQFTAPMMKSGTLAAIAEGFLYGILPESSRKVANLYAGALLTG